MSSLSTSHSGLCEQSSTVQILMYNLFVIRVPDWTYLV